jgi:hypothetical protein
MATDNTIDTEKTVLGMKLQAFVSIVVVLVSFAFTAGAGITSAKSDVAEVKAEVSALKADLAGYRQRDIEFAVVKEQMARMQADVAEMKTMLKELSHAKR